MDYKQIWERWLAMTSLSEADRKHLILRIHEEVRSGAEMLGVIVASEINKILDDVQFTDKTAYLEKIVPIVTLTAMDGYLLFLIVSDINPDTASLAAKASTERLGKTWSEHYKKDQNISYLDSIDPVVSMLLSKIYELRVNQALATYPDIAKLSYQTTEKIHQFFAWATFQGFILGRMESELAKV